MSAWKVESPCVDCPFNEDGAGLHLRKTLRRGRWQSILKALRTDQHFMCHKTTPETGNGRNLVCAGALAWQDDRGLSSNYVRVCQNRDYFAQRRRASIESR